MSVPKNPDYSKILAGITLNTDRKSLRVQLRNAIASGAAEVAEACRQRLKYLKAGDYLGAFKAELSGRVSREPGRRLSVWLPLAHDRQGNTRGRVAAEIRVDESMCITIEDLTKNTLHSSLSNLRAAYGEEGGGSDSWSRFAVQSGASIADYLGVDPNEAHESRRS